MSKPLKQTRKVGDALLLSGDLTGDTIPEDAAWAEAVGKINIRAISTKGVIGDLWRDHEDVTLIVDETPKRFEYVGAAPADEDIGNYLYEVEVTFPSLDDPLTWPNDATPCRLEIVAALG